MWAAQQLYFVSGFVATLKKRKKKLKEKDLGSPLNAK